MVEMKLEAGKTDLQSPVSSLQSLTFSLSRYFRHLTYFFA